MRILLITHIYPPAIDGGSKVIYKLGQYFQSHGHQIKVLSSNCYSTDDFTHPNAKHTPQGLPVITIFHKFFKHIPFLTPFAKGPIFNPLSFILSLLSIIKYKPDLIIAGPLPTMSVLYARLIRFFTKSKLLINASFHPTDPDFHSPLLVNTLKSADYLWTLTDYETNYFHQKFNIPISQMINVGNGIDKSYLSKNSKLKTLNSTLIFIGSLASHKGIKTLLKLKHKIYLCGKPTLYSKKLKFPKNIIVKHNLSDIQIKKLIQKSSILILPSSQESFGLVLLEAWACHKPVITSNIPQLTELINKSGGGLTFKLDDSNDLQQKVDSLLHSKTLYSKLSNSGYHYASTQTWDKIGEYICRKIGF